MAEPLCESTAREFIDAVREVSEQVEVLRHVADEVREELLIALRNGRLTFECDDIPQAPEDGTGGTTEPAARSVAATVPEASVDPVSENEQTVEEQRSSDAVDSAEGNGQSRSPAGTVQRELFTEEESVDESHHVSNAVPETALPGDRTREGDVPLPEHGSAYASLKRVQLVYDGDVRARPTIRGTEDSLNFFTEYWAQCPASDQERFVVACLNTKNRVQCVVQVSVGTLDASLVHAREVFKPAILEGSSSVLLSHNHPSGDPAPSQEDREVTQRLEKAGELLGIAVLDHIIYGDSTGRLTSLRKE